MKNVKLYIFILTVVAAFTLFYAVKVVQKFNFPFLLKTDKTSIISNVQSGHLLTKSVYPPQDEPAEMNKSTAKPKKHKFSPKEFMSDKDNWIFQHNKPTDKTVKVNKSKRPEVKTVPEEPVEPEVKDDQVKTASDNAKAKVLPLAICDEKIVVEKAKKLGLRRTFAYCIYCQAISDRGDYEHLKHYVWNPIKKEFILLPDLYYIGPEGINNDMVQADIQKYHFTTVEGLYYRNGKYYRYNTKTEKFYETNP